jgi:hypothetical protein
MGIKGTGYKGEKGVKNGRRGESETTINIRNK